MLSAKPVAASLRPRSRQPASERRRRAPSCAPSPPRPAAAGSPSRTRVRQVTRLPGPTRPVAGRAPASSISRGPSSKPEASRSGSRAIRPVSRASRVPTAIGSPTLRPSRRRAPVGEHAPAAVAFGEEGVRIAAAGDLERADQGIGAVDGLHLGEGLVAARRISGPWRGRSRPTRSGRACRSPPVRPAGAAGGRGSSRGRRRAAPGSADRGCRSAPGERADPGDRGDAEGDAGDEDAEAAGAGAQSAGEQERRAGAGRAAGSRPSAAAVPTRPSADPRTSRRSGSCGVIALDLPGAHPRGAAASLRQDRHRG